MRRSHISEREARRTLGRAPQARSFLRAKQAAREARDENVRAKRADFFGFKTGGRGGPILHKSNTFSDENVKTLKNTCSKNVSTF